MILGISINLVAIFDRYELMTIVQNLSVACDH